MKVLTTILCLLSVTVSGQSGQLIYRADITAGSKDLMISITLTNLEDQTLYIVTSNFYVATNQADSSNNIGLLGLLKSETDEFIPYNYPITFIQMENVKRQVRRSARINRRQQPKIKINPNDYLIIKKGTSNTLTVKIPLKYWTLSKGQKYDLILDYKEIIGIKEPNDSNYQQVSRLKIETGQFIY